MSHPARCYECGGTVAPLRMVGRVMRYKNMPALDLPNDLAIPTCDGCGEEFLDAPLIDEIDAILAEAYELEVTHRAQRALEELTKFIPKQQLEVLLGLSQGYLSKLRTKRTSPALASLLMLMADDPKRHLRRLKAKWKSNVGSSEIDAS